MLPLPIIEDYLSDKIRCTDDSPMNNILWRSSWSVWSSVVVVLWFVFTLHCAGWWAYGGCAGRLGLRHLGRPHPRHHQPRHARNTARSMEVEILLLVRKYHPSQSRQKTARSFTLRTFNIRTLIYRPRYDTKRRPKAKPEQVWAWSECVDCDSEKMIEILMDFPIK